jgi:hypothetical protein
LRGPLGSGKRHFDLQNAGSLQRLGNGSFPAAWLATIPTPRYAF